MVQNIPLWYMARQLYARVFIFWGIFRNFQFLNQLFDLFMADDNHVLHKKS